MITSYSEVPLTSFANLPDMSGFPPYREVCRLAAEDPAMFARFREIPTYRWVVSSVIDGAGVDHYEALCARGFDFGFFDRIRDLDGIGGPTLANYPLAGAVAPQTVRYVKVLSDVERLFGSLAGKSVIEIGVGFGGQCAVLSRGNAPARYTLVDLPEPLMVARRYLEALGVSNVAYATLDELAATERYDLVISNFALSEIARRYQIDYAQRVLQRAAAGYLLWNSRQMRDVRAWHVRLYGCDQIYAEEMCGLVPDARIFDAAWLTPNERAFGLQLMAWGTRPEATP
jgi:hypothetical protein